MYAISNGGSDLPQRLATWALLLGDWDGTAVPQSNCHAISSDRAHAAAPLPHAKVCAHTYVSHMISNYKVRAGRQLLLHAAAAQYPNVMASVSRPAGNGGPLQGASSLIRIVANERQAR